MTTPQPVETTTKKTWQVDESSNYACPAPGYYPFEGDCVRFYKCVELEDGSLKGLLYKCPSGYGYSEERQRCWPEEDLPACRRIIQDAHLRLETATPVYPEDLFWFFNNRKWFESFLSRWSWFPRGQSEALITMFLWQGEISWDWLPSLHGSLSTQNILSVNISTWYRIYRSLGLTPPLLRCRIYWICSLT